MLHIVFTFALAAATAPSQAVTCASLLSNLTLSPGINGVDEVRAALDQFRRLTVGRAADLAPYRDHLTKLSVTGPREEELTARRARNLARALARPDARDATLILADGVTDVRARLKGWRDDLAWATSGEGQLWRERADERRPLLYVGGAGTAAAVVSGMVQFLVIPVAAALPEVFYWAHRRVTRASAVDRFFAAAGEVLRRGRPEDWAYLYAHVHLPGGPAVDPEPFRLGYRQAQADHRRAFTREAPGPVVTVDLLVTNVRDGVAVTPRLIGAVRTGAAATEVAP